MSVAEGGLMVKPEIIELMFKATNISRWNDYPRMMELSELDKQAHKFIIAYFLAKLEGDVDLGFIIRGGIFQFFARTMTTDIRPDIFHKITQTKQRELESWVWERLSEVFPPQLLDEFKCFTQDEGHCKERLILQAAGYLATRWEFGVIHATSEFISEIELLKNSIEDEFEDYISLVGVQKIARSHRLARLVDMAGRLRFQRRWALTRRLPETSVLGHMLIVAVLSFFYSLRVGACEKRLENNFFCALFHDLPEVLTRDIITPVKHGVSGLDELLAQVEMRLIDERILPNLPRELQEEFAYILGVRNEGGARVKNEFQNRIRKQEALAVGGAMSNYNTDLDDAIDGRAVKQCDTFAAFAEAGVSISCGVKSKDLLGGYEMMFAKAMAQPPCEGVDFKALYIALDRHFFKDEVSDFWKDRLS